MDFQKIKKMKNKYSHKNHTAGNIFFSSENKTSDPLTNLVLFCATYVLIYIEYKIQEKALSGLSLATCRTWVTRSVKVQAVIACKISEIHAPPYHDKVTTTAETHITKLQIYHAKYSTG